MASFSYNTFKLGLADRSISLTTGSFRLALVTTGYFSLSADTLADQDYLLNAPNSSQSVHAFEPSTATGYSRQPVSITTFTEVDAQNAVHVTGSTSVVFSSVSSGAGVIGGAILFIELAASNSSGRRLCQAYEFSSPVTPNGGDIIVEPSTQGWVTLVSTS